SSSASPLPPLPPLFPYTTPFRSLRRKQAEPTQGRLDAAPDAVVDAHGLERWQRRGIGRLAARGLQQLAASIAQVNALVLAEEEEIGRASCRGRVEECASAVRC